VVGLVREAASCGSLPGVLEDIFCLAGGRRRGSFLMIFLGFGRFEVRIYD
jgi:hypothetical protein